MSTKLNLLSLLEDNKDSFLSGEEIALKLNISRTAVWKAVKGLRLDGYKIEAVTNKGYCLKSESDIISEVIIHKFLDVDNSNLKIDVIPKIDSTNNMAREKAISGEKEGYTVISNEQTNGRGRYGRNFFSPNSTGVYMSVLLRPSLYTNDKAIRITTMAAVAMCEAIEAISDKKPKIKWVNDIFIDGKKICGILTEASFGFESGLIEYAVMGIGTNIYKPQGGFPEEIENIAGYIFDSPKDNAKNKLCAEFLNRFMRYYKMESHEEYTRKYKEYSFVIGKNVDLIKSNGEITNAKIIDINDKCELEVMYSDGNTATVSYGEIKIKL